MTSARSAADRLALGRGARISLNWYAGCQNGQVVEAECPRRCRGRVDASDLDGRGPVDLNAGWKECALLHDRAGGRRAVGADRAAVADDGAWFHNRSGTDVAAVDH